MTDAHTSLTARVMRGAAWVFLGKLMGRGMQMAMLVVLARLLVPGDFGLFGIVMLAIAAVQTFTQTGFNAALVQRRGDTASHLDTAWTIAVVRGIVLAGLIYAGAPLVGGFFNQPRAVPLLRVMCAGVAVEGFTNVGTIYFQKDLRFGRQVAWSSASAFVRLAVGVVLAYRLHSVWALVWAALAGSLATCVLSYAVHPYRPRLRFSVAQATELHRFGRWVLGSSVLIFLATNGDGALLGKLLGPAALGLYQVAYRLSNAAATEITHLTNAVMMPAYAQAQGDSARLRRGFLQVFEVVVALALPLSVFLVLAGRQVVLGLLGAKWASAVLPLQLLAGAGLLRAVAATGGPIFIGTGRPHRDFWMNLCRLGVIAVSVYPLTKAFGVAGTCISVLLGVAATLPVWASVARMVEVSWREMAHRCLPGLALAALVALGVQAPSLLPPQTPLRALLLQLAAAGLLCGAAVWASGRLGRPAISLRARSAWNAWRTA